MFQISTHLPQEVCAGKPVSGSCSQTLGRMAVVVPHPPGLSVSTSIAKGRNIVGLLRGTCYPECLSTQVQKPLEPRATCSQANGTAQDIQNCFVLLEEALGQVLEHLTNIDRVGFSALNCSK